jgi:DNA repair exonuclease SbcCD ATPase subunit
MIKSVEYTITFPSSGKTLAGAFTLEEGVTAVVGPNWSGKSFGSIEIFRYMLFGKKALRGPATDYKSLSASMTCAIAGVDYLIERTSKKETITRLSDDEILAVNTEAVNQKVIELLGFGLEIFDFVCAAPQGEVQEFSKLRPAQRKQLIDKLLRLQPQERVEKACKDKAKDHRTTATALASTLRAPVEPVEPENYTASQMLNNRLEAAKALRATRAALSGGVLMPLPDEPPRARVDNSEIVQLQAYEDERREANRRYRSLLDQVGGHTFAPRWSEEVLGTAEAYLTWGAEVARRGDAPIITLEAIEEMEKEWTVWEIGEVEVTCPNCKHEFVPAEAQGAPAWPKADLRRERQRHALWAYPLDEVAKPGVVLTRAEITADRLAVAEDERINTLIAEMSQLPLPLLSKELELTHARTSLAEWSAYDQMVLRANAHNDKVAKANLALANLPPETEDIDTLYEQLSEARVYESELANYERGLAEFRGTSARLAEEQQLAVDFAEGAKAIGNARRGVKAHLAPALSRVASSLIDTMTAGQLTSITVDEEMEVMVGSQDINTLSGAGKTIANLALRIAMGQVLTARVFPVFIGDEIDSDMDAGNAAATAEALAALSSQLKQVILVTHKQFDLADHLIIHPVTG